MIALYFNARRNNNYFLAIALFAAAITSSTDSPYLSRRSVGFPLSPNESLTATNSCGVGNLDPNRLATHDPRPPLRWCSSAVTKHPVLPTDLRMASLSNGLIVCMLSRSTAIPSLANDLAASSDCHTPYVQ